MLKTLLAQAPNWQAGQPTPKWVAAENLTRPVIESVYIGQRTARAAMEDLAQADQRAARLTARAPETVSRAAGRRAAPPAGRR